MSPELRMPPSAMRVGWCPTRGRALRRSASHQRSIAARTFSTAVICGTPQPVTMRVVHTAPGPTPTFTAWAPASSRSHAPSAVATLPATIQSSGCPPRTAAIVSVTRSLWPWATSITTPSRPSTMGIFSRSAGLTPMARKRCPGVRLTHSACVSGSSTKRWITPIPPASAIAVAIASSVTVSMFALMIGNSSVRSPTRRVLNETSLREYTDDLRGTIRTSSNVNPFSTNFTPMTEPNSSRIALLTAGSLPPSATERAMLGRNRRSPPKGKRYSTRFCPYLDGLSKVSWPRRGGHLRRGSLRGAGHALYLLAGSGWRRLVAAEFLYGAHDSLHGRVFGQHLRGPHPKRLLVRVAVAHGGQDQLGHHDVNPGRFLQHYGPALLEG